MKICFIPIDNRPVCYNLAKEIAKIDENIELYSTPIRRRLGGEPEQAALLPGQRGFD